MDKKTYVKKLKKMLIKHLNTIVSHCPVTLHYNPLIANVAPKECKMCQNFVGLKFRGTGDFRSCPCFRPNTETAVKRAWKYIKLYEQKYGEG